MERNAARARVGDTKTPCLPFISQLFPYFSGMKYLIFVFFLLISFNSFAQPTWQQRVDTKIDVQLDDRKHMLNAFEEFIYTNNSPDTLRFIYVHLWPNAYKNDHTPFAQQMDRNGSTSFYYSKQKDRGYIDSLQFMIDGLSAEHFIAENAPDIARLDLLKPLLPGASVKVSTPFRVKIPIVFSRMGHTGQAYFISQWFPKPAVYDQKGWHAISYLDQGEFFSEYGSYDVNITLPENYVLMATGNCMNEKENKWLDSLASQPLPDDTLRMPATTVKIPPRIKSTDTLYNKGWPSSSLVMKTVHFHEDNVHDFAWFADKRWIVRKDTVLSPGNNKLVTTWAAFLPSYQSEWKNATGYMKETVKHYGKWVGPYQYSTIKAVLGDMHAGGGMEYPTVTIVDKSIRANLKMVIVHELGHNWFYGMLGSNEREHPWMDEGLNTFYEQKTTTDLNEDSSATFKIAMDETALYFEHAATHEDQAIDQPAANFTKLNYGLDVYYKTALALKWLEKYIGHEDFERGMKDYYDKWHFHHPYPEHFRACLEKHTTRSIGWFFETILNTDKKIDFTITKISDGSASIRNNTGVNAPVLINAYVDDSLTGSFWTEPFIGTTTIPLNGVSFNKLSVDDAIPDGKKNNNVYHSKGIFHHFGLRLKPYFGLNESTYDKIFFLPYLCYNQYDGIMPLLLLHNLTIPENRFRFAIAPMYSFATKAFTGAGSIGYLWYPGNFFKEIMLQADAKTFHFDETHVNLDKALFTRYTKVAPSLNFTLNEYDPLSTVTRTLLLKGYGISEEHFDFGSDSLSKPSLKKKQNFYGLLRYKHQNKRTYNPFDYSLEAQMGTDFAKVNLEGNMRIDYNKKNKSLHIRGYLGKFFPITSDPAVTSRYMLNASYSGVDDYLYDGTYIGRNAHSRMAAQQISIQEGGFKIPLYNGAARSDNWMATVNLKTDLPLGKLPIRLFLDAGLIPNTNQSFKNTKSTTLLYDAGIEVYVVKDIVSFYYPVIMSSDFQNYITNTYGHKNLFVRSLSFNIHLQNINWLKAPSTILKTVAN